MKRNNLQIIIIKRLILHIFKINLSVEIDKFLGFINHLRKSNGLLYTIKYMKAAKLHITRYMCGKPLYSNNENVALDKTGFPLRFWYLKRLVNDNPRALLTLLTYTRRIVPNKSESKARIVKLSTITDPYKGKVYTIPKWFILDFISKYNLSSTKPIYTDNDHYLSIKGSPNGKASMSSLYSIISFNSSNIRYLFNIVGDYQLVLNKFYQDLSQFYTKYINRDKLGLGKLSIVHDPELKERVIAMVDYTTQFALRPIHNILLNNLSKLPCDRTFTQDPFHKWNDDHKERYHSLDLSAATDRFPIFLQQKLISLIFNDYEFGKNWRNLLVDRNYDYQGISYRYSVGQPMGAYTSWAAFTLTHHLVVHWAAELAGLKNFKDYIILGDDIVIKNNKVAQIYINLMTKWGVDISLSKTHVSYDTYEFAKRWIKNGKEISGISLKGILTNIRHIHVVYMNIFTYLQRIPSLNVDILTCVGKLYGYLLIRNRIKSPNTIKRSLYDFHHSIRYSFGLLNYEEIRNYLHNKFPFDNYYAWPERLVHSKLNEIFKLEMVESAKSFSKDFMNQSTMLINTVTDNEIMVQWPLYKGFMNHIEKLKDYIKSKQNQHDIDLLDLMQNLRFQNLDSIVKKLRNSYTNLIMLDKFWKSAFNREYRDLERESILTIEKQESNMMSRIWDMALSYRTSPMSYSTLTFETDSEFYMMPSIWDMASSSTTGPKPFTTATFKTDFVGLSTFDDKLLKDLENLKIDITLRTGKYTNKTQPLESKIHQHPIECIEDNKVPNFNNIK
ncbi:RNA-dependent RNA polymerase, putative [Ophiostoma mitovirus 4]|uniref:RNA-dependent RNA polymerase, putative n=1 Tax=Ophiostoma mitovirus 4 TaxID=88387 RepID=Q9WJ22_9VIRU|nr:RNA-dependent RNA polymerase, putative [Ophiostoma mitovirus 4]CAB42652.1 RNA-dependent RNA polymerase, putative [Ophiostoma mitovirus 4]